VEQGRLDLSVFPKPPRARSHRLDPETSTLAANRMNASGEINEQCKAVLELVRKTPGLTSAELAEHHHVDRALLARRLPDLREAGLLKDNADDARFQRVCKVSGTKAIVWIPKP
jgi:predicted HTH transcriptional regulator